MPPQESLNRRRVAITALGVVSPLGIGRSETLRSLQTGRDCISPVTRFDVSRSRATTAGQLEHFWRAAADDERAGKRAQHPASRMLSAALREAMGADEDFQPQGIIVGTTSGGMSYGEAFYRAQLGQARQRRRADWIANYSPQKPVLDALSECNLSLPMQIIANACASGTNALGHAWSLISSGQRDRLLCGGYDAISEMVFAGFDSLQASTQEKVRPFDKSRTGLVLGEGAAILAMEEWQVAKQRGAPIIGEITGYGISTDNFHLTQPHPSGIGPLMAMERALASAHRTPAEIGYINAHGTATTFNDATEGAAISQLFGAKTPVSSTKSMMGHSLGAAGAIEAAFTLLALQHSFLPPNINYETADPQWELGIVANEAAERQFTCAISNSFGFGGTNASIVLERVAA